MPDPSVDGDCGSANQRSWSASASKDATNAVRAFASTLKDTVESNSSSGLMESFRFGLVSFRSGSTRGTTSPPPSTPSAAACRRCKRRASTASRRAPSTTRCATRFARPALDASDRQQISISSSQRFRTVFYRLLFFCWNCFSLQLLFGIFELIFIRCRTRSSWTGHFKSTMNFNGFYLKNSERIFTSFDFLETGFHSGLLPTFFVFFLTITIRYFNRFLSGA